MASTDQSARLILKTEEFELIEEDIHSFLDRHQHKELLRFVAVGSVDDGKSTLIGRLLHDTDQVYEDQLADARSGNDDMEIDFALLTDGLRAEREQGITIDVAYRYFNTQKRKFIIADTPGHIQYTRNMATGASTADVAVILIDARLGVLQQSKRHAYIASLLGIPHLTVCVNKMDLKDYEQQVYESIKRDFRGFTQKLHFQEVSFLPISAKFGDNVVNPSEHMPWYAGPTLLDHLEQVPVTREHHLHPFRLPVQYVLRPHQDYRGFAGQIASGVVKRGDPVLALPSGKTSRIKTIDTYDGALEEAFSPMSVTLCLEDEIDISRGDLLVHPEAPPTVSRIFDATLVWMNETPLNPNQTYLIKHSTQVVKAEVQEIFWKSDPNTLEPLPAQKLVLNEIGKVRFQSHRPIFFDDYQSNRGMGAFILIDYLSNETLAAGMLAPTEGGEEGPTAVREDERRWSHFQDRLWCAKDGAFRLDVSQMQLSNAFLEGSSSQTRRAFEDMKELEAGAIANPDEGRMVGHYWLRHPGLAPRPELREAIEAAQAQVKAFVGAVHSGDIKPEGAERFTQFLLVGIGGSALGPQFLDHALAPANPPLRAHFLDNTDPDGTDRVLQSLELSETLVMVVSKSGGTKETRNGMLEAKAAFEAAGLDFAKHAVAVTGEGSALEKLAQEQGFLEIFPMWDWVGGRTSLFSAVGLLPAALAGIDIDGLCQGAAFMDQCTRVESRDNPAAWMALAWLKATQGKAARDMVLLPYKDRLVLFSRYIQQLVMESLGKEFDRDRNRVHQGIAVYGNKGSTDQHAFIQQLREGPDDFFATFIEVLQDREGPSIEVEQGVTSGDYLMGFLLGTREAFRQRGRYTMTLTLPDLSPHSVGALVALFERSVGFYASMVNVNAYHQPGVEAGKKAAAHFLRLQGWALELLRQNQRSYTVEEMAAALSAHEHHDALFYILEHLCANGRIQSDGASPLRRSYKAHQ